MRTSLFILSLSSFPTPSPSLPLPPSSLSPSLMTTQLHLERCSDHCLELSSTPHHVHQEEGRTTTSHEPSLSCIYRRGINKEVLTVSGHKDIIQAERRRSTHSDSHFGRILLHSFRESATILSLVLLSSSFFTTCFALSSSFFLAAATICS